MFFGKPRRRALSWQLGLRVARIAASDRCRGRLPHRGRATTRVRQRGAEHGDDRPRQRRQRIAGLAAFLTPSRSGATAICRPSPEPGATQTAVCLPSGGMPDRWQISEYPSSAALRPRTTRAAGTPIRTSSATGKCNAFSWGGERAWLHGPDKPGGRVLCYFEGNDAVIVWTHQRLGQPSHRTSSLSRARAERPRRADPWWRPWHHEIGKAN